MGLGETKQSMYSTTFQSNHKYDHDSYHPYERKSTYQDLRLKPEPKLKLWMMLGPKPYQGPTQSPSQSPNSSPNQTKA